MPATTPGVHRICSSGIDVGDIQADVGFDRTCDGGQLPDALEAMGGDRVLAEDQGEIRRAEGRVGDGHGTGACSGPEATRLNCTVAVRSEVVQAGSAHFTMGLPSRDTAVMTVRVGRAISVSSTSV